MFVTACRSGALEGHYFSMLILYVELKSLKGQGRQVDGRAVMEGEFVVFLSKSTITKAKLVLKGTLCIFLDLIFAQNMPFTVRWQFCRRFSKNGFGCGPSLL